MEIELRFVGLMMDPIMQMPFVVLREPQSSDKLAFPVGAFEALAISNEIEDIKSPRPMTHDLIRSLLDAMGAKLQKIVITDVDDNIFFGTLHLETPRGALEIDCRPSDGIALALKYRCPILATDVALEKSKRLDLTAGHQESERVREWLASLGEPQLGKYEY